MTGRHISRCINEWLEGCPFNQPDAITAIREEYAMAAESTVGPFQRLTTPIPITDDNQEMSA